MCEFCKTIYGKPQEDHDYFPDEDHIYQFSDGTYNLCVYCGDHFTWKTLRNISNCLYCGRKLSEVAEND